MSNSGSLYIEKDSIFHRLDGSIKLVMLLTWTAFIFMFMDVRIFSIMTILGLGMLYTSKVPYSNLKPLLIFILGFTVINSLFLMLITPEYGSEEAGTFRVIIQIFGKRLTWETVFYVVTLSLKYFAILPITMLFVFTTHPSRFASSLNRVGVSYRVGYAVNIALRYIPDVKDEMINIIHAQEARGVSFNKKETSLGTRLKNYTTILIPLLLSSLNRVEVVSNAMDLRGFGRFKKRTWYNRRPLKIGDYLFLTLSMSLVILGIYIKVKMNINFWYPFS